MPVGGCGGCSCWVWWHSWDKEFTSRSHSVFYPCQEVCERAAHFCPKIQQQSATDTTAIICYVLLVFCRWTETIAILSTTQPSLHSSYLGIQGMTSPLLLALWHRALCQVLSHLCEASLADSSQEIQYDETAFHVVILFQGKQGTPSFRTYSVTESNSVCWSTLISLAARHLDRNNCCEKFQVHAKCSCPMHVFEQDTTQMNNGSPFQLAALLCKMLETSDEALLYLGGSYTTFETV